MLLSGHTALVTGAGGRLGPIWCAALEEAGAQVVRTDVAPHDPSVVHFDITSPGRAQDIARTYDPDIVINNAGVDDRPRLGENEPWPRYKTADSMLRVNLLGTYTCLTVFGSRMAERPAKRRRGVIVNVASLYGLVAPDMKLYSHLPGFEKHAMYGATKAGIVSLTKYFAAYYGPQGVRVNAIAPGGVIDPNDPLTGKDEAFIEKYTAKIPMGRMCTPADLGQALVFLASDQSAFVTGQTLVLDGGFTCW